MSQKITPSALLLLAIPTFLWAGNTVVGRLVNEMVPPITLNFIRWLIAFFILLAVSRQVLAKGSELWHHWRYYSMLGLLGIGLYNALQYMALQSSTPINVSLVNASVPIWVLLLGLLFFKAKINVKQIIGAVLSLLGVATILIRGDIAELIHFRFVIGDIYMVVATIIWALYSWLLAQDRGDSSIRSNWTHFLLAQVTFGVVWSGLFAVGEWALTDWYIDWSWNLVLAMFYVATGPAVIAFGCWAMGVRKVGPAMAGFFVNLMPFFAAILSVIFLDEAPQLYHAVAFLLIIGGILYSSRSTKSSNDI